MSARLFWLIALILGFFQLAFTDYFRLLGVSPDLILTCVVIAGMFFELRWAIIFSALLGVFKDSFSLSVFGYNTILFSLWGFLTVKVSRKVSIEDNLARTLLLFIVALLHNITCGLLFVYSGGTVPLGIFLRIVFLGALYTALPVPLILKFVKIKT